MPDLSPPSETLRAAAARLRELAERATPGPWDAGERCVWTGEGPDAEVVSDGDMGDGGTRSSEDALWIATMSPAVAEPLAVILTEAANMYALYDNRSWPAKRVHASVSTGDRAALAFARCILEGQDG